MKQKADLQREPFEKLEQFIYDGQTTNILERYVEGKKIRSPFEMTDE